jgi:predicted  nucleic acid-binding Zn-ribbon protein
VEKSIFFDYFKRAQELEEKLKSQIMDMTKHIDSVRGQANKNRNQLSKIFNNVRNQLATRENELKQKIAEVMMNQEEQIETKKQILEEQVDQIGDFKRRVR